MGEHFESICKKRQLGQRGTRVDLFPSKVVPDIMVYYLKSLKRKDGELDKELLLFFSEKV